MYDFSLLEFLNSLKTEEKIPLFNQASMGETYGNLSGENSGSTNPVQPSAPYGGPSAPNNGSSGPNKDPNNPTLGANRDEYPGIPKEQFEQFKADTAVKLRKLFLEKPFRAKLMMNDPQYEDQITSMDHNVVCKVVLDEFYFEKKRITSIIIDEITGGVRYKGCIDHPILWALERKD